MARPPKIGLDYFPLDVHMQDEVELLEAEFGLTGFAILIKLWQKIYSEGYYVDWSSDNALLFARKINTDVNLVNEVVNGCLRRSLLNKRLYKDHSVLTSKGIQSRYEEVCIRSKRKHVVFKGSLLLIKTQFTKEETPQRKEKEKKEKVYSDNAELNIAIESFIDMRKKIKSPMTDNAINLMLKKLDKLGSTDLEKIAILEQSIMSGWKGIFALSDKPVAKVITKAEQDTIDRKAAAVRRQISGE